MNYIVITIMFMISSIVLADNTFPSFPSAPNKVCVKSSCELISCNDNITLGNVKYSCRNQLSNKCINNSYKDVKYRIYDEWQLTGINNSCKLVNSLCPKILKRGLDRRDKVSIIKIIQINKSCKMVNPSCIKETFSKLSKSVRRNLYDITSIARSCKGHYQKGCVLKKCEKVSCYNINAISKVIRKCVRRYKL